jgi:hypothetical protein
MWESGKQKLEINVRFLKKGPSGEDPGHFSPVENIQST